MRTCALYGSNQEGAFCTFETRKDAQNHFGITYKNLMKMLDKPGENVLGWTLTSTKPADYVEDYASETGGVYVVDSISNLGSDLIKCLKDESGNMITQMRNDGYLHATSMCDSFGKLWADFARLERTSKFMRALSTKTSIPIYSTQGTQGLIDSKPGGYGPGTWVHPKVAIKLAEWLSVDFELAVNDLVESFLRGTVTTEQSQAAARTVAEAVTSEEQAMKRVKFGDDVEGKELQRRHDHGLMLQIKASSFNALKLLAADNPADQALVNTSRTNFLRKHLSMTITDDTSNTSTSNNAVNLHTQVTVREVATSVLGYTGQYTSDKFLAAVGIQVGVKWAEAGHASVKRTNNVLVMYIGTNLAKSLKTNITEPVSAEILEKSRFKYSEIYLQSRAIHNAQTHDTWTYPAVHAQDMIIEVFKSHKDNQS